MYAAAILIRMHQYWWDGREDGLRHPPIRASEVVCQPRTGKG